MKPFTRLISLLLLATCSLASHAELRPFTADSLQKIESERQGKAFILGFWSASCTHCPAELRTLAELAKRHPKVDIVLVAADTPDESAELQQLAQDYGLARQAQWVFADAQPERLRRAIDRRWYGELPRTYLYNRQGQRQAYSGLIPAATLESWVSNNVK